MSYANMFELTSCLEDALRYCEEHPEREHVATYHGLLKIASRDLKSSVDNSDHYFSSWRMEHREDKLAWKHLSKELAAVQKELSRVNALGYIDQRVLYWDQPMLAAAVAEMIEYLREHKDNLDFAVDKADKLERMLLNATDEDFESAMKLKNYLRFSQVRSDAMKNAVNTIAGFRKMMRKDLGRDNQEYLAVKWPQAVASDEAVL